MPYMDKDKQREFQRNFVRKKTKENPSWYAELKRRRKQNRQVVRDVVARIKSTLGCLLCQEVNPDNLQFHHVLPTTKTASIADMVSNRTKLVVILKEIDKCVCVCNACHQQLGSRIQFLLANIQSERWYNDWGLNEALEWSSLHPQNRMKTYNFFDILKAVARNCQFHDVKNFNITPPSAPSAPSAPGFLKPCRHPTDCTR